MKLIMLIMLIVSAVSLIYVLLRQKGAWQIVTTFCLHGVMAFVLLYLVNTTGWLAGVHVATNIGSLVTVGVLGVPGLAVLVALQTYLT
ncbi:pro-sigmaK processing inhibitor BofA family protein [Paenibacillus sp. 1001270B_150601_E10]|uniref:pro-sigmaK processing inhibitor BofA family protein n=1 Tax=Paenibacillus sp. 1001270B_150601_E10 TaxID=2787079 RepID=UPI0018A0D5DB|nr:pro-sigmaK processing inhibitor BofA family protein [Paenibacillus sp. 1001270B_150601_E10]